MSKLKVICDVTDQNQALVAFCHSQQIVLCNFIENFFLTFFSGKLIWAFILKMKQIFIKNKYLLIIIIENNFN